MTDIAQPVNRGGGCYMMPEITVMSPSSRTGGAASISRARDGFVDFVVMTDRVHTNPDVPRDFSPLDRNVFDM